MSILIVGFGSPHGNDQLGWKVIDSLVDKFEKLPQPDQSIKYFRSKGNGIDWYIELENVNRVILIDAVISDEIPGGLIHQPFDNIIEPLHLTTTLPPSSHGIEISQSVELARTLYPSVKDYFFLGATVSHDTRTSNLSEDTLDSISKLANYVWSEHIQPDNKKASTL